MSTTTLAVLPTIPHPGKEQVARGGDDIDEGGPRFAEAEVQTDAASPLHDDDDDDERETLVESFGPPSSPGARSSPGSDSRPGTAHLGTPAPDDNASLLRQLEDAEKSKVKAEERIAEQVGHVLKSAGGGASAVRRACGRCRDGWRAYWWRRTAGLREANETLSWALNWMQREYPEDFRRCMVIIVFNAVFSGASPILKDQLLGAIIPNYQAGVKICLLDLLLFSSILILGQMLFVWATFRLNISKMDGAGFVPLFQQQLARHISRLPQAVLDKQNESQLMAMMEKDVNAVRGAAMMARLHPPSDEPACPPPYAHAVFPRAHSPFHLSTRPPARPLPPALSHAPPTAQRCDRVVV